MDDIKVAVIMPLPACNMFCNFCITEDNFDCMSFEQALFAIEHIGHLGIKNIVFGGGEPFSWPHNIIKLCENAKDMGFLVQIGTNATCLPDGYETLSCIDRFVIPLESADEEVHNSMRFFPTGHFGVIMDCLKKLKDKKSVTISTVLTNYNINGIVKLAEFLRKYDSGHIHAWHLYQFIPEGRGGRANAMKLAPSPKDYYAACEAVRTMELPFHVFKRPDMYKSKTVGFFCFGNGNLRTSHELGNRYRHSESNVVNLEAI